MTVRPPWRLRGFEQHLDDWIALESPPGQVRTVVLTWLLSRIEDPYAGARRVPDFENLWYAVVPGSIHAGPQVVACAYWIEEATAEIRCDSIASLGHPA